MRNAERQAGEVPRRAIRGKLCDPWHLADRGEFDEAEPERKWHVHLRRK